MSKIFLHTPRDGFLIIQPLMIFVITLIMAITDPAWYWWLPTGLIQSWLICNVLNSSLHHHSHWSTYTSPIVNRLYELFLGMVTGTNFTSWKIAHLKHHKWINDVPVDGKTKDPVSVFADGKNGNRTLFWNYIFIAANLRTGRLVLSKQFHIDHFDKKIRGERSVCRLWIFFLLLLNPLYGVWMLLVFYFGWLQDGAVSYGEHWGVLDRRGDTTQDSIGIYSRWYNIIGFNAGYHQEHHNQPGLHWSRLPEITNNMHPERKIIGGMHVLNNPFLQDFKALFRK